MWAKSATVPTGLRALVEDFTHAVNREVGPRGRAAIAARDYARATKRWWRIRPAHRCTPFRGHGFLVGAGARTGRGPGGRFGACLGAAAGAAAGATLAVPPLKRAIRSAVG